MMAKRLDNINKYEKKRKADRRPIRGRKNGRKERRPEEEAATMQIGNEICK